MSINRQLLMAADTAAGMCKGIIESNDIASLSLEIEKALNYCKKCNMLVESVKRKDTLVCVHVEFEISHNC